VCACAGDKEGADLWAKTRAAVGALKLSPGAAAVLQAQADAGASYLLGRTLDACLDIVTATSTVASVTVSSAVPLTPAQQKEAAAAANAFLPKGKKTADVSFAVDAALGGGLHVAVDDRVVDLTSASILLALAEAEGKSAARA
jgi:F0F1-type ATP synthase delta subunit